MNGPVPQGTGPLFFGDAFLMPATWFFVFLNGFVRFQAGFVRICTDLHGAKMGRGMIINMTSFDVHQARLFQMKTCDDVNNNIIFYPLTFAI